jgi:protein tyrosine phosphatase (PTP) superfamily phosphohydrolase (DUF442 family)
MGVVLAVALFVLPFGYYRWGYVHGKRLRVVTPGRFYRSGQLTVGGFREAIARYHIRTIVNAQDEYPDPDIALSYFSRGTVKESALCRELGVRYVFLPPQLISRRQVPRHRPESIDRFLALLDDPASYPVLVHCKAGLHRTGVLTAVYRMEYEGWSPRAAVRELKANGFGDEACTSANDYIVQYVLSYQPGQRTEDRKQRTKDRDQRPTGRGQS